jgi:hypothetical protein
MQTFTEAAEDYFQDAIGETIKARDAKTEINKLDHVNEALSFLLLGLNELSGGLRATYIRIEQLDSTIKQLDRRGSGILGR